MAFINTIFFLPNSSRSYSKSTCARWTCCQQKQKSQPITANILREYERYIRETATSTPPAYLDSLLYVLTTIENETITPPSQRTNIHPFVIPLTKTETGGTGLLRWPTPPSDFQLPIVKWKNEDHLYLELISPSAKTHVTRALIRADVRNDIQLVENIRSTSSLAFGYKNGDVEESGLGIEAYLAARIGGFPDIYEGLSEFHFAKGDMKSCLVAAERSCALQDGWARPHTFHSRMLIRLNRIIEAKDAARFGLTLPLWTIKGKNELKEMVELAGYQEMDSLGKIYRRLYEDKREHEIQEGKKKEQVALDRAAFLLDLCVAENWESWELVKEDLGKLYMEAGLEEMATFVKY